MWSLTCARKMTGYKINVTAVIPIRCKKESEALYTRARNGMPHPCTKPIDSGQAVAPHIVLSLKKKTMPDTGPHHRR